MKQRFLPLAFVAFAAAIASCASEGGSPPPEGTTTDAPNPVEIVESPKQAPPAADQLSKRLPSGLPAGKWSLHDGMEILSNASAEEQLEAWVKGEGLDADKIASLSSLLRESCDRIDWTTAKKRGKNPEDFDRHVSDVRKLATELGEAALAGAFDGVPSTADRLIQRCVDCHTVYK